MSEKITLKSLFPTFWTEGAFFRYLTDVLGFTMFNAAMDMEYLGNRSGLKTPSPLMESFAETFPEGTTSRTQLVAMFLYQRFGDKWTRLWEALKLEYNVIENYSMTETESTSNDENRTREINTDISVTGTGDSGSDVYGFNSSTPVPQAATSGETSQRTRGSGEDNTETETAGHTGSRELTRAGNIGITTSQQMIASEFELRIKNDFYRVVYEDTDSVLTIPIYDI